MRILITGATGSIGSRISTHLARNGHAVVAFSRDAARARRSVPVLDNAFTWEPMQGPPPAEAFDGVHAILNLAGEAIHGRWTARKKQLIHETRVRGTQHLVDAIAALPTKPAVLISGSAIGYYGSRGDEELAETSSSGDDFLANLCKDWEAAALKAEEAGMRVVRIRTSFVMSDARYGIMASMLPTAKLGLGGPLGSGGQWWPWIHVADYARLVEHLMIGDLSGPVNGASPNPIRQRDFSRTLGRVLRRPAVLPVPAFALRLLLGEFAVEVLSSRRVVPKAALDSGFTFQFPDLEAALRDVLGRPVS